MSDLLKIQNVSKSFDGVIAVKDASFAIRTQDIVAITGENGAGKTTLFNLIAGLERPDTGTITFKEQQLDGRSPLEISRSGITRLYQHARLFRNLRVWENLVSAAENNPGNSLSTALLNPIRTRRADRLLKQEAIDLLRKFKLADLSGRLAGEISFGEQKLVSFCMVAMRGAQLALLDEPFSGLNPQMIERLSDIILLLRKEGITFLVVEHNIPKALALADRQIVMSGGISHEVEKGR